MTRLRRKKTSWQFPEELDWTSYLGGKAPAGSGSNDGALFDAVLDDIWSKMGLTFRRKPRDPWLKKLYVDSRKLKALIDRARSISDAGRRAFLKDRGVWYYATLVPSMGGEIEEIRRHTREFLKYYVKKYGSRR